MCQRSNKKIIGADLISFAIGVSANINFKIISSTKLDFWMVLSQLTVTLGLL